MGNGRQGMAGNGHTSRVWKGDGRLIQMADTIKHGYRLFLLSQRMRRMKTNSRKCNMETETFAQFDTIRIRCQTSS